jgi:hypothetical protein
MDRRRVIKTPVVTGALAATSAYAESVHGPCHEHRQPDAPLPHRESPGDLRGGMLYRQLGWIGYIVSRDWGSAHRTLRRQRLQPRWASSSFSKRDHFDGTAQNPAWLGNDGTTTMQLAPENGG